MIKLLTFKEPEFLFCCMRPTSDRTFIQAASSRDYTRDMSRVKSSNIWSRKMNVRNPKDKFGDVYIQFKGSNGGPDDIYVYYDVPVNLYRKWISSPSAGHFFWINIRNRYNYSKLTGDKRGKLRNAINH